MSTSAVPGEIRIETVSRRAWLGFAAVLPWQFLAVLDFFVVNIAISSIKGWSQRATLGLAPLSNPGIANRAAGSRNPALMYILAECEPESLLVLS
jgi:hypothetical protein